MRSMVCGYHICKNIWDPCSEIGEILECKQESLICMVYNFHKSTVNYKTSTKICIPDIATPFSFIEGVIKYQIQYFFNHFVSH